MNVLVLAMNKDDADKLKGRIFDVKFGKMNSGYPDLKGKFAKDVQAVIFFSKDAQEFKAARKVMLKEFDKYLIKAILGKGEAVDNWKVFGE